MKQTIKRQEILFYTFFILCYFVVAVDTDMKYVTTKIALVVAGCIVVIKMMYSKYSLKQTGIAVLYVVLASAIYINSGVTAILLFTIFLLAAEGVHYSKILNLFLACNVLQLVIRIVLSSIGIINNKIIIIDRMIGGYSQRYSLGFVHPNYAHMTFCTIIVLYCWKKKEKINIFYVVAIMILNLLLYRYTVSRTGFIIVTVILLLFMLKKIILKYKKVATFIPIICSVFSILSIYYYRNTGFWKLLNELFQGRLFNAAYITQGNPGSLFGRHIQSNSANLVLDNAYVIIFHSMGVVIFTIYIGILTLLLRRLLDKNLTGEAIIIIIYSIYGITEGFLSNIFMNPSLVLIVALYYNVFALEQRKRKRKVRIRFANK